ERLRAAAGVGDQVDAGGRGRGAEPAAVPGAAGVEAVVVGVQHGQRAGPGDAVGAGLVGDRPARVVEAWLRFGRFGLVLPVSERRQRYRGRGLDRADLAAGRGERAVDAAAVPGDRAGRGEHLDGRV